MIFTYASCRLVEIAVACPTMPWGLGDPEMIANPESNEPYHRFLHEIVATYKPDVALELGVYRATATCHMAMANSETMVIGIDHMFQPEAYVYTKKYSNTTLVEGDTVGSLDIVRQLIGNKRIGLLFLDSEHDGDTPWREFVAYRPLFEEECLVCCDDILGAEPSKSKMREFWDKLPGEKIELNYLHPAINHLTMPQPGFGISIVRKHGSNS